MSEIKNKNMSYDNDASPVGKIVTLVLVMVGLFAAFMLVKIKTVSGNELGVLETWSEGVVQTPLPPKTHLFFPGFTKDVYIYNMGMNVLVYNDTPSTVEKVAHGREHDSYIVQSSDQQDMRISFRLQWRRRPEAVVKLHTIGRDQVEERVLRTPVLNVVKNQATVRTALDAYSGTGLVKLQNDILKELQNNHELKDYVVIEGFVIEHIALDKKYTAEIVERQVAVQEKLKNDAKTDAAKSAAEMAKAQAQADYEKVLVEARRDKEKGILEAEKTAQQQILDAEAKAKQVVLQAKAAAEQVTVQSEAEKARNVLIALGEREAAESRAKAILALGEAEAKAKTLSMAAYTGPGAEMFAKIEIAKSFASGMQGVRFYPANATFNTVASDFGKGLSLLVGQGVEPANSTNLTLSPTTK